MINTFFIVIYIFLTVSGLVLFKLGSNFSQIEVITKGILSLQISFTSLIGIFCYLCSFIIYLFLVSRNALSFLFPIVTGIVYISVLTASIFILKEKVTPISIVGSLFILIGVILIIFKGKL